jgi:protein SCO1/2
MQNSPLARPLRAAVLVGILAATLGCSRAPVAAAGSAGPRLDLDAEDPADFGPLPDFRLVASSGEEVTRATLEGRPLVIAALFTTCSGPCPRLAAALSELQQELRGTDALLVTVSVDPAHDTPEVLRRYAQNWEAEDGRWIFLTGPEAEIYRLVREGFYLAVERAPREEARIGEQVTHDTRFLAVDRAGRRRGWYAGTDPAALERLRERMLFLARE